MVKQLKRVIGHMVMVQVVRDDLRQHPFELFGVGEGACLFL